MIYFAELNLPCRHYSDLKVACKLSIFEPRSAEMPCNT